MKKRKILKSPYDLVGKALELDRDDLSERSAMGHTPNWDSLNHMDIINEIEREYGITIPNENIEKYTTMRSIIEVYDRQSGPKPLTERVIDGIKKIPVIGKFFK
jgi:acyl carrier protein